MQSNTELILEESGIEIIVVYEYEKGESQIEKCHGEHEVGNLVYTELTSVEIVIKGSGVDILQVLNEKQKEHIISLLTYEKQS